MVFWRRPDSVRVGEEKIKKGALELIPIMPLMNVTSRDTPSKSALRFGTFKIEGRDVEMYGVPVSRTSTAARSDPTTWPDDCNVAAYWWFDETSDMTLVNITADVVKKNGVTVPVLKNHVDLEPHVRLYKCKHVAQKPKEAIEIMPSSAASGNVGKHLPTRL